MDFILELLFQLVVQLVFEILGEALLEGGARGAATILRNRVLRSALGALLGFGFGLFWGAHLSGGAHWPRLLWVSLSLAVAAAAWATGRERGAGWERPFALPWTWSAERLYGFAALNVALAAGIAVTFRPA